jgi:hypothetical protein
LEAFAGIKEKLRNFIRKYYTNELIKGTILFVSFGLIYLIVTLLIEHYMWFNPSGRTWLFWLFVLVELGLAVYYLVIPLLKLTGLREGLTDEEASALIGRYFPEIDDRLLNTVQLGSKKVQDELIAASIRQKAEEIRPFSFRRAISFRSNRKYLKYALIPVIGWALIALSGESKSVSASLDRVMHYTEHYSPPAPFYFELLNDSLSVVQGDPFMVKASVEGNVIPDDASIYYSGMRYFMERVGPGEFQYEFTGVQEDQQFYFESNGVRSELFTLKFIPTPVIQYLKMVLNYPNYTGRNNEVIEHTGNASVPVGTEINWQIEANQTDSMHMVVNTGETESFLRITQGYFSLKRMVTRTMGYAINTSNVHLRNFESLDFEITTIPDEYPQLLVKSDIDSVDTGPVQFAGQVSDDYGIRKLQLIYHEKSKPEAINTVELPVDATDFSEFYLLFPEALEVEEGKDYVIYFEAFDNDGYHGSKKTRSRPFLYYRKTREEVIQAALEGQKESLEKIAEQLKETEMSEEELEEFRNELSKKQNLQWNDTKKMEQYLDRQERYQEMYKRQTEELQRQIEELPVESDMQGKKELLQERIEEIREMNERQEMLDKMRELTDRMNREEMMDRLKKLSERSRNSKMGLERLLELTKRFYVEQKSLQIADRLDSLSREQEQLADTPKDSLEQEAQNEIGDKFDKEKEAMEQLKKDNERLSRPMSIPDSEQDMEDIEDLLEQLDEMDENNDQQQSGEKNEQRSKNQRKAAQKMKKISEAMQESMMMMEGEMIDENIEDLRKIVENLIEFSFQQEDLLERFNIGDNNHPDYPANLRRQRVLKDYFEHIDDSLYTLSLRIVTMGQAIQQEVSDAHYNIDEALTNFSENRFEQGRSNQQFVITAANNLANNLSDLLEQLQNASARMGSGQGSGDQQFSLPDIIQKQGELNEKMQQQEGREGRSGEEMNGELFEIYQEQERLRQALESLIERVGDDEEGQGNKVIKEMEDLEMEMLEQGVTKELLQRATNLNYEMLKWQKARKEQGIDEIRQSTTNTRRFGMSPYRKLEISPPYFNYDEILQRQSLPLRTYYRKRVQEYFKIEGQRQQ